MSVACIWVTGVNTVSCLSSVYRSYPIWWLLIKVSMYSVYAVNFIGPVEHYSQLTDTLIDVSWHRPSAFCHRECTDSLDGRCYLRCLIQHQVVVNCGFSSRQQSDASDEGAQRCRARLDRQLSHRSGSSPPDSVIIVIKLNFNYSWWFFIWTKIFVIFSNL